MYKVTKRNCPMFGIGPYVCEFICDTASDISTLPTSISEGTGGRTAYDNQKCASGSVANVAENGAESKQYMLNNQNIWCPYSVVSGSSDSVLEEAKAYTDSEIADLINGAPTTRDTLKEIADAMAENQTVVEALDAAIGTKANKTDIPTKTSELENDSGFLSEHQDLSGYAKKTDIPTALPADGGNADTVDGKHADDFVRRYGALLSIDYVSLAAMDTDYKGVIDSNTANSIGLDGSNSCWWHIIGLRNTNNDGHGTQIAFPLYPTNSNQIPKYRTSIKTIFQGWKNLGDGGNADKINGLNSDDFRHTTKITLNSLPSQPTGEGDYFVIDLTGTDFPYTWGYLTIRYGSSNNEYVAIFQSTGYDNEMYINTYRGGWLGWKEVYTSGNKPYVTGEISFANQDGNSYKNSPVPTNHGFMPSKVLYWELPSDCAGEPYQVYSAISFDETSFTPYKQYGSIPVEGAGTPSYRYGYIIFK